MGMGGEQEGSEEANDTLRPLYRGQNNQSRGGITMTPQKNEKCCACRRWNWIEGKPCEHYNSTAMTAFGACGHFRMLTIEDAERLNAAAGHKWFSPAAMKSFNSKIETGLLDNLCFVSSERDKGIYTSQGLCRAWDGKRRYTVRLFIPETGEVETISEFGEYATRTAAVNAAKRYEVQYRVSAAETPAK